MSKYKITGIIYIHVGMWRERERGREKGDGHTHRQMGGGMGRQHSYGPAVTPPYLLKLWGGDGVT